jgi:hypothetical protein
MVLVRANATNGNMSALEDEYHGRCAAESRVGSISESATTSRHYMLAQQLFQVDDVFSRLQVPIKLVGSF